MSFIETLQCYSPGFITHEDMIYWKTIAQIRTEEELQVHGQTVLQKQVTSHTRKTVTN